MEKRFLSYLCFLQTGSVQAFLTDTYSDVQNRQVSICCHVFAEHISCIFKQWPLYRLMVVNINSGLC